MLQPLGLQIVGHDQQLKNNNNNNLKFPWHLIQCVQKQIQGLLPPELPIFHFSVLVNGATVQSFFKSETQKLHFDIAVSLSHYQQHLPIYLLHISQHYPHVLSTFLVIFKFNLLCSPWTSTKVPQILIALCFSSCTVLNLASLETWVITNENQVILYVPSPKPIV